MFHQKLTVLGWEEGLGLLTRLVITAQMGVSIGNE